MEYSTLKHWQEVGETGIVYELGSLYDRFQNLDDPRKAHGKRYQLVTLMMVIFVAKLCGKDKPLEIADWAKNHAAELASLLQLKRAWMPHHNTIRRVFQSIVSVEEFDRLAQEYSQQEQTGGGQVWALDGKTLRGTATAGVAPQEHVLSLYDVYDQQVLAQVAVDRKENEIPAAARVLEQVQVAEKIITADALHTQRTISAAIVEAKGAYIFPVKENQPRMYEDIQRLFAPDQPKPGFGKITTDFQTASKSNSSHGRFEQRTIETSAMLNDYLDWPGLGQVYRLVRCFSWLRQGKVYRTSCETEYGITSLSRDHVSAAQLLQLRRQHWRIETGLHYRRDVTFHEDATRMTIGAAGRILATIHNLVIGLIKRAGYHNTAQGRRHYEGYIAEAFALLLTVNSRS
jgi:predicted transposase YbfD/YdcC